ncbi:DUF732 domain-containing protein [Mycobacterium sp. GA-2829]|uniref:DUF732 domain-containing protein n=1 Tax=Mycobacterium sp. GA-2829 TaxID=1772283 RepID=UPI00073FE075|nr:DUF732 domain-containing protein [Mycobacterium sp. GA-2829]KUI32737.1 hypothetical protein AU194_25735 [Mycobacterium sp. GA-2829]
MIRAVIPTIAVAAAAMGGALAGAPPAAADEAAYLELQQYFAFLTADQLLREGYWVCRAAESGMGSSEIVPLVMDHLKDEGSSVAIANRIVSTAIVQLDC